MPSRVEIDIRASDNASATLDSVRNKLQLFDQFGRQASDLTEKVERSSRSFTDFDISASKAARGIRTLAAPIAAELSPALGQLGGQMAGVIATAAVLGTGIGALAIGAAALAGIVGGKLVEAWRTSREEATQFQRVLASGDFGRVTAQVETLTSKIRDLSEELRNPERLRPQGGLLTFGFRDVFEGLGLGPKSKLETDLERNRRLREERERLRDVEVPGGTIRDQNALLGQNARATFDTQQAQRGIFDYRLPQIAAAYRDALRKADDLERAGQVEAAGVQRRAAADRRQFDFAGFLGRDPTESGQGFESAIAGANDEVARMAIEARRAKTAIDELRESLERDVPGGQAETIIGGVRLEDTTRGLERRERERVDALRDELALMGQLAVQRAASTDLTLAQREALSLEAIETERLLKLDMARNAITGEMNQAKEFAANIEAQLKRQQVLEATDPVAGVKRGIANIEVEFGSAGLRMQSLMQNIGGGMAGALDDTFFSVVTGKFQDLPDIARRFGHDMVRAFTSELAKMATSAIFGQLRTGFESLFPGGASGTSPFGAGSGGGPAGYAAGGGSGGGPLLTSSGRPLAQSELDAAYAAGGDAGVRALRSGEGAVVGGEFVQAGYGGVGSPEFTQSAYALNPSAPMGGGFGWRQGLGIAGSAALLGLTAYGATGAQSTGDVVTSGVAGALAGATLGAQVGGLAGYGGTGAAVGAVAGAAIAGTIAFLAKQEADKQAKKERQAAEVARAVSGGSALVQSASQAQSLPDLFRRITAFGSGSTGGTSPVAVSTTVQTPTGSRPIGIENPTYPVATLQDLLRAPESLRASIQAGVSPASLAGPNAATSSALQAIAADLVTQFRETEQGVGVTQEDLVGGLTRRTTVPASRADQLNPALPVEIDELALNQLDAEDRALLQLELMSKVAAETDFVSTISDGATGQRVSITRIARSSMGFPPAPPPPGVPAGAVPAIGQVAALNIPRFPEAPPRATPIYNPLDPQGNVWDNTSSLPREVIGWTPPAPDAVAAYEARRVASYQPFVQQLDAASRAQLQALSAAQVRAAIQAGLIPEHAVPALIEAGLLPALLPDLGTALTLVAVGAGAAPGADVTLPAGVTAATLTDFAAAFAGRLGYDSPLATGFQSALAAASSMFGFGIGYNAEGQFGVGRGYSFGQATPGSQATSTILSTLLSLASPILGLGYFTGILAAGLLSTVQQAWANQTLVQMAEIEAAAYTGQLSPTYVYAQQLAMAARGVPFVSDPTAPTGYAVDPTQGYIDANGNFVSYHTAGNPSGNPTNPNTTNFGEGEGNTSGGAPSGGSGAGPGGGADAGPGGQGP